MHSSKRVAIQRFYRNLAGLQALDQGEFALVCPCVYTLRLVYRHAQDMIPNSLPRHFDRHRLN